MRTRPRGRLGSNGLAGSDGVGGASTRIADVATGDLMGQAGLFDGPVSSREVLEFFFCFRL
jgi:hypothetical protein